MGLKTFAVVITLAPMWGCSSTPDTENVSIPAVVPDYVKIPHPHGLEKADLLSIFMSPLAPKDVTGNFAQTCASHFERLESLTSISDEMNKAAEELVIREAEQTHWCFYAKVYKLYEKLHSEATWNERQSAIVSEFQFLSPVAKAFQTVYSDSRYKRWASQYYSKVSEWVFFKKLTPTPESSSGYVNTSHSEIPVNSAKNADILKSDSIFSKYGIELMGPDRDDARMPASVAPLETLTP